MMPRSNRVHLRVQVPGAPLAPFRGGLAVGAAWAVAWSASTAIADTVLRRGAAPPLQGEVTLVNDQGVRVRTSLGAEHLVPWDRVADVQASRRLPDLERQLERAEQLWRARSRVERGDTALAEPLLERLFVESRGQTGETALVVAEGLLRCRLARGEQAGAVVPALEMARLRRAGVETTSYAGLPPVIEETTGLSPALPPIAVTGPMLDRLRAELAAYATPPAGGPDPAGGDPVVRAMAQAYLAALALDRSGPPRPPEGVALPGVTDTEPKAVRDHPGVGLLRLVLATSAAEVAAREAARKSLVAADLSMPWQEAWRRLFLGISLLREESLESRRRGVVELVHLPARSARSLPWLSGVALALSADELEREGAAADAATLRRELDALHPHHPIRRSSTTRGPEAPTTTEH